VRQLLLSYLIATVAALCLFLFAVAWQAVAVTVRRWQSAASRAAARTPGRGGAPAGTGEHSSVARGQAA